MSRSRELDGLTTLPQLLQHSLEKYSEREALREFNRINGSWQSLTFQALGERIEAWRRAYAALELPRGARVAILLPNGINCVCADLAALANALVPVPLHSIDTPGASAFILADSEASILIINNRRRWEQILATGIKLPRLKNVLIATEEDDPPATQRQTNWPTVWLLSDWLNAGAVWQGKLPQPPLEDELAGVVYTSGTTGRPKGVMLTHRNIVSNVKATLECVSPQTGDIFLSFLPLSHTFERTAGYYLALATGCLIVYNRSILLLAEDLKAVKPTVIISVPRVYERIYARLEKALAKKSALARWLFDWAVEAGWRDFCRRNRMQAEPSKRAWLDRLVLPLLTKRVSRLLQSQFGGRLRIAISGGAALTPKVAKLFCGLGLPIIQGYGMTEASPIIAGNCVELNQPNTVGRPFVNIEIRLAEGGEIQLRGPSITQGYWRQPEKTAAVFTPDGWLRTGDVGEFTRDGLLKIKGRIKEIIVTSTGEKIPPADLESAIEMDPLFAQAFIYGEGRPFLALIAVADPGEWESLAHSLGMDPDDHTNLDAPAVKTAALKRAKAAAASFPNYALPRAVILTLTPWTIENGLLTPTLKLKRIPLTKHFNEALAKLYGTHG